MLKKVLKFCLSSAIAFSCLSLANMAYALGKNDEDQAKIQEYQSTLTGSADVVTPVSRGAIPSKEQMDYYKEELSAFIHFGPNTFTGNEWGHGTPEEIAAFNPSKLDTDQWVTALKDAGFKKIIITAKHHDGFQLWPSEYSQRNVGYSPFGLNSPDQGDVLARLSASCTKYEMDMGLYLSPWDMGETSYGQNVNVYDDTGKLVLKVDDQGNGTLVDPAYPLNRTFDGKIEIVDNGAGDYNQFYLNQLKEVLGNDKYGREGKFVEIWMDGAKNDPRYQEYDLKEWWSLCRELEPGVLIFNNIGNDVRWVGNESGFSYDPIWAQVDPDKLWNDYNLGIGSNPESEYPSKLQVYKSGSNFRWKYANSYEDGGYLTQGDPNGTKWSMPEADYSIIGDWFWKNKNPQSGIQMTENYFQSVGNATPMLLNTPPNQKGLLEESYIESLREFRSILDNTFATNVTKGARAIASSTYKNSPSYTADNVVNGDYDSYWAADEGQNTGSVTVFLDGTQQFDLIDIKEYVPLGQNVSDYEVEVRVNGAWKAFGRTGNSTRKSKKTIGYQSILRDNPVDADAIRLTIKGSYGSPKISEISAYKMDSRIEYGKASVPIPGGLDFIDAHSATTTGSWNKNDADTVRPNSMSTWDSSASATYKFTGTRFILSSRYSKNFGGIKVTVDNGEPFIVNLNDPNATTNMSDLVYYSDTLEAGEHTVLLQPVTINGKSSIASDGLFYLNNDSSGMFEIENPSIEVEESKTATMIVNRIGGSKGEVTVQVNTAPGTAVNGRHYETVDTVLTFKDGETTKEVALPTIDNDETTGTLYYSAALSKPSGKSIIGFNAKAMISILDNEVDTSKLLTNIENAEKLSPDKYEIDVWQSLQNLISDAKIFLKTPDLTQKDVDSYNENLNNELKYIREKGTYTNLSTTEAVKIEFEDGELDGGAGTVKRGDHPNYTNLSGTGMVIDLNTKGNVTIWFNAPKAGEYTMNIQYYSGGPNTIHFDNERSGDMAITGDKDVWKQGDPFINNTEIMINIPKAGMNKLKFIQVGSKDHPNLDCVTFTYNYVPVTQVDIMPDALALEVGQTHALEAVVLPVNASDRDIIWTSSNSAVATVSKAGVVEAVSAGTAMITGTVAGTEISDTVKVSVAGENLDINKTALSIAIEMAESVAQEQLDKVVPVVANEFKAALENAKTVYAKASASQEEVDNAFDRLASVMQMLEFYKGDKAALEKMMNQIANLTAGDYTEATWNALQSILPDVNEVIGNVNAMQDEVNEVYTELVKAFINLRLKPNKDLLEDLIKKAESFEAANYSVASYANLVETLNAVKAVYDNPNAKVEEVMNAQYELTKAIAGLEVNPNNPPVDNSKLVDTVKSGDATVKTVKTGDNSSVEMFISLSILTIVGISVLRKRKKLNIERY